MMDLNLPQNIKGFLEYMEKVHSFGAAIPNPLVTFGSKYKEMISNKRFYERGFTTNYALYLCGSDLEMIVVQVIAAILLSKLATK